MKLRETIMCSTPTVNNFGEFKISKNWQTCIIPARVVFRRVSTRVDRKNQWVASGFDLQSVSLDANFALSLPQSTD